MLSRTDDNTGNINRKAPIINAKTPKMAGLLKKGRTMNHQKSLSKSFVAKQNQNNIDARKGNVDFTKIFHNKQNFT